MKGMRFDDLVDIVRDRAGLLADANPAALAQLVEAARELETRAFDGDGFALDACAAAAKAALIHS